MRYYCFNWEPQKEAKINFIIFLDCGRSLLAACIANKITAWFHCTRKKRANPIEPELFLYSDSVIERFDWKFTRFSVPRDLIEWVSPVLFSWSVVFKFWEVKVKKKKEKKDFQNAKDWYTWSLLELVWHAKYLTKIY